VAAGRGDAQGDDSFSQAPDFNDDGPSGSGSPSDDDIPF
jgi:hypothetical protein